MSEVDSIKIKNFLGKEVEVTEGCIRDCLFDLFTNFLYYDRKGDEELPVGVVEKCVEEGLFTKDKLKSIVLEEFSKKLDEYIR